MKLTTLISSNAVLSRPRTISEAELRRQQRNNREHLDLLEKHAGSLWTIFGVLFPDGFDNDAGFIANLDKSKDSDGKFLWKHCIYRLI